MDQNQTEFAEVTRHVFNPQERPEWYRVNLFLMDFGSTAENLGLRPEDLVQIGGTAIFFHAYKAFGPKAVVNFRGTHDMDLISFHRGSAQRVLDAMVSDKDSFVANYAMESSFIPNKRKISVFLDNKTNPGVPTGLGIDYWEAEKGQLRFNDRIMTKDKLVLDPPVQLELLTLNPNKTRGLVSVTSLRDSFIIKMDVLDYSRHGLRSKDKMDILAMLPICDAIGYDFVFLIDALKEVNSPSAVRTRLRALEALYTKPGREVSLLQGPLRPTPQQLEKALRKISSALRAFPEDS